MSFFADLRSYGFHSNKDTLERKILEWREKLALLPPISYMRDVIAFTGLSLEECLRRAQDKNYHKELWYTRDRTNEAEYQAFYQESDFYIFRQPWRYRLYTWHFLTKMLPPQGSMVDYGCGAACATEWMSSRYPEYRYVAADIQSSSLEFAKFRLAQRPNVEIKTIGLEKAGLPLDAQYDLITCCDVMEHTYNPDEIFCHFIEHLAPNGLLYVTYQDFGWDEGENLDESRQKRGPALQILKEKLIPIKAVDDKGSYWGLYRKLSLS
ncbi:MAG: class I SAM-dependent methyltransferase [Anaerolineae bacterium]|nr:class I SAM-dependent methyltransferase [Anaerolineae bacterium]